MEGQPTPHYQRKGPENLKQRFFRWIQHARPQRFRNTETQLSQPMPLKQYLLETAKRPNLVLEKRPKSIDLGEFGREAEKLIHFSLADPKHPEYANQVCVDQNQRILLLKEPIRGDADSVELRDLTGKRRVFSLHSHGDIDTPFSSGDLESIFISPMDSRADAGIMLVTPTIKMLLFRTNETPVSSDAWKVLDMTFDMYIHPAMNDERELTNQMYQEAGGDKLPFDTEVPFTREGLQKLEGISYKRMFALKSMAHTFHLEMYACAVDKNIATPVQ